MGAVCFFIVDDGDAVDTDNYNGVLPILAKSYTAVELVEHLFQTRCQLLHLDNSWCSLSYLSACFHRVISYDPDRMLALNPMVGWTASTLDDERNRLL